MVPFGGGGVGAQAMQLVAPALAGRVARHAVNAAGDAIGDALFRRKRRRQAPAPRGLDPYPPIPPRLRGSVRYGGFYNRYGGDKELKFFDITDLGYNAVGTGGSVVIDTMFGIAAGTGESQRIGRAITVKSIHLKLNFRITEGTTQAASDDIRVIIFKDMSANGAAAGVTDLLETANWLSFRNLGNSKRFRFLYDKTYTLNCTYAGGDGTNIETGRMNMPCFINLNFKKGLTVDYSGVAGALTEICCNNVGMLLISSSGSMNWIHSVRVRYTG